MDRLDFLLKEKERIEKEIADIETGEVVSSLAKLHIRQYKEYQSRYTYSLRNSTEKRDWALSIKRINLNTGFSKWEPIVASKNREEVIEWLKKIVKSLTMLLEEVEKDG